MSRKRYAFDMEMLTVASLFRMRVVELPVQVHQSVLFSVRSIIRMLVDIAVIVYQAQKGDRSRGVTWLASWLRNPSRVEEGGQNIGRDLLLAQRNPSTTCLIGNL